MKNLTGYQASCCAESTTNQTRGRRANSEFYARVPERISPSGPRVWVQSWVQHTGLTFVAGSSFALDYRPVLISTASLAPDRVPPGSTVGLALSVVGGNDLLHLDEVSVAWTAIPHARGVDFRSLAPMEGESATPIRRPRAVVVTDDGLGLAVAECDLVGGHSAIDFERGRGLNPAHRTVPPRLRAPLIIHFGPAEVPFKQRLQQALRVMVATNSTSGRSASAQEATLMPRTGPGSL
jgi:hypothetical protein